MINYLIYWILYFKYDEYTDTFPIEYLIIEGKYNKQNFRSKLFESYHSSDGIFSNSIVDAIFFMNDLENEYNIQFDNNQYPISFLEVVETIYKKISKIWLKSL